MREHASDEPHLPGNRFLERMNLVWAAIFYLSLGLSFVTAWATVPDGLRGWTLTLTLCLVLLSAVLFQVVFWRSASHMSVWPLAWRSALIYFAGQLLCLSVLLSISDSFVGLGLALMGQSLGALRPRHWALVLVPLGGLLVRPLGWFQAEGDWVSTVWMLFQFLIWMFIAALLGLLFAQRFRLLRLVYELRQARTQLEHAALQQEELAMLRERTRLARRMHDSLGHALVAVTVKLEAAQRLYRVDAARGEAELEATCELVRTSMTELRHSLADLRAPLPDQHDLPTALRRLAREVSARSKLAIDVAASPELQVPPQAVAEALYLIAREALLNIERHASAHSAEVALWPANGEWCLEIADDGIGVRPYDLGKPGHFGLVGMRERAEALGGKLLVAARPDGGTRVAATLPDRLAVAP